jgi:hypothetical protein
MSHQRWGESRQRRETLTIALSHASTEFIPLEAGLSVTEVFVFQRAANTSLQQHESLQLTLLPALQSVEIYSACKICSVEPHRLVKAYLDGEIIVIA